MTILFRAVVVCQGLLAAGLTIFSTYNAHAQAYPTRVVRILVPTAPGGNHDALTRAIAEKLATLWNQPVVVESKAGANTRIATVEVAKSKPDGYTLLSTLGGFVQNLVMETDPGYQLSDFRPVGMFAVYPTVLAVNASIPAKNLAEFVSFAKSRPKMLSFGSFGSGSSGHIIGAGLNRAAGIDLEHIPYKGEAAAFPDLVSGRINASYGSAGFFARQAASGSIKLIAIASPTRLKDFPDLQTFAEAGYPNLNLPGRGAIFAPAGTPQAIITEINEKIGKIVQMPDIQQRIYEMGFEPATGTPEELDKAVRSDIEKWGRIVKENEIKLE